MQLVRTGLVVCALAGCVGPDGDYRLAYDAAGEIDAVIATPDAAPVPDAPPLGQGVQTLAGSDQRGDADGPRNLARFNNPVNIARGPDGNLYVADFDNNLIRVVAPDGYVTTLVEQPGFRRPFGLTFAADGSLYAQTDYDDQGASEQDSGTIWKVDTTTGVATVIVRGVGRPRGLLALADGRLLLSDMIRHDVRVLDPDSGEIEALAGLANQPDFADGAGEAARFDQPYDAVLDADGSVLLADMGNHCIRRLTLDGQVTTIAGTGWPGADDGPALAATFNAPRALALDETGTLYVTDTGGYSIRSISADGQVTTVAGDGTAGFADGQPAQARFFGMEGLDVTRDGSLLYVADGNRGTDAPYHRVRRVALEL